MLIGTPVSHLFKLSLGPSKVSSIVENLIYNRDIIFVCAMHVSGDKMLLELGQSLGPGSPSKSSNGQFSQFYSMSLTGKENREAL